VKQSLDEVCKRDDYKHIDAVDSHSHNTLCTSCRTLNCNWTAWSHEQWYKTLSNPRHCQHCHYQVYIIFDV